MAIKSRDFASRFSEAVKTDSYQGLQCGPSHSGPRNRRPFVCYQVACALARSYSKLRRPSKNCGQPNHPFNTSALWPVKGYYEKLFNFLWTQASSALDMADKEFGLKREEACHDILFDISFNAFGRMLIMLPSIVKHIAHTGSQFPRDLAEEVCGAVGAQGSLNGRALESMALVRSTMYEVLRIDPFVPL